jgi:hypothetical protein
LNVNTYTTRKTIAQGMLDLALLTANAAQLKRIMTIGNSHRFYTLLVTLITISICLQVVIIIKFLFINICLKILFQIFQACIMFILAIVFDLNKINEHQRTNIANNILLCSTIITVAINIVISIFDIAEVK